MEQESANLTQYRENTNAQNDALKVAQDFVCDQCGGRLSVPAPGDGEWQAVCGAEREHQGYRYVESGMELAARGEGPAYMLQQAQRQSALQTTAPLSGQQYLAVAGQAADKFNLQPVEAHVFMAHVSRLGLDPFFNQIVPLTFNSKKHEGKRTVQPFVTEKGWAALAARDDEFMGPPGLRPVLGEEKEGWGYNAADIVYAVSGRKKSWPAKGDEMIVAYTAAEQDRAKSNRTPAAADPHHMCRIRAIRRWYEENFPDARAVITRAFDMIPEEAVEAIEGEFTLVADDDYARPPSSSSAPQQPPDRGPAGSGMTDPQRKKMLGMADSLFGWSKEDLEREWLGGNNMNELDKTQASQVIDRLIQQEKSGESRSMFDRQS